MEWQKDKEGRLSLDGLGESYAYALEAAEGYRDCTLYHNYIVKHMADVGFGWLPTFANSQNIFYQRLTYAAEELCSAAMGGVDEHELRTLAQRALECGVIDAAKAFLARKGRIGKLRAAVRALDSL